MRFRGKTIYEWLTMALLFVLPINYMVFNILLKKIPYIKFLKDVLMIALLVIIVAKLFSRGIRVRRRYFATLVSVLGIVIIVLIRVASSSNMMDSLYTTRLLVVPLLFCMGYIWVPVSDKQTIRVIRALFFFSVILALWGIFQAFVLRDTFLINLNYKGDTGRLSSGFYISGFRGIQRVTSTFAAPNLYAMYTNLMLFLFIAFKERLELKRQIYIIGITILVISDILTFSRSGWLGLGIAWVYYLSGQHKIKAKHVKYFFVALVFAIIGFFTLVSVNENVHNAFDLLLRKTFNRTDASLLGHFSSISDALDIIQNNFFGYHWLGYSGPRTRMGIINYNVESSLLLMGLELGFVGAVLYVCFFVSLFKGVYKGDLNIGIKAAILSIIPSLLLLPLIEEYEMTTFVLIIVIMANNVKQNKNYAMDTQKSSIAKILLKSGLSI